MEQYNGEKIVYPLVPKVDFRKYGFLSVEGGLLFSSYFIKSKDEFWRKFIVNNLRQIATAYWFAMNLDSKLPNNRNRKLSTFLRYIWEQDDINVANIMISAINSFEKNLDENIIIGNIINIILPNAGYRKKHIDGKYIWKMNNKNIFDSGINKIFVLEYINSGFNKDVVWKQIKKYCYLKDGIWRYKNASIKRQIDEILSSYLKNGGLIVEQNVNLEFNTFVPLSEVGKDLTSVNSFIGKSADGKKYVIHGVASDTSKDSDDEVITQNFIKSMKKHVIGLPLKVASHYSTGDLDQTVGMVTGKSGDADTLFIQGEMQPPEENPNVKKLVDKMNFGIKFGFSIYGRVTRLYRGIDEKTKKETVHLDDGVLSHILITDQPANKNTFAEGIFKSLDMEKITGAKRLEQLEGINKFKHNSNLSKSEPDIASIILSELPVQAFPLEFTTNNIFKEYPHHYIQNNELYLHKGMLVKSFLKAKKVVAHNAVVQHLLNHINVIGLSKAVEDLNEIVASINDTEKLQGKLSEVVSILKEISDTSIKMKSLHSSKSDKMKVINPILSEAAQKISTILSELTEE